MNMSDILERIMAVCRFLAGIVFVTAVILLLLLLVMLFSENMHWNKIDFTAAGLLLAGTGIMYKLTAAKSGDLVFRVAAAISLSAIVFLVWLNLAVGLIGTEDNPLNLMVWAVVAVAIIGAFTARFQSRGMSHAMFAAALMQIVVGLIGVWLSPPGEAVKTVLLNAIFVILFVASALMFQRAACKAASADSDL